MQIVGTGAVYRNQIELLDEQGEYVPIIASFVRFLGARDCSPNTVVAYLHDLKLLFGYLSSAGMDVEQFKTAHLIDFITYLTDRRRGAGGRQASTPAIVSDRLAPATINRILAGVSTFYEHLVLTGAFSVARNPLEAHGEQQRSGRRTGRRSMRMRRIQRVPRPLSDDQVMRLLSVPARSIQVNDPVRSSGSKPADRARATTQDHTCGYGCVFRFS